MSSTLLLVQFASQNMALFCCALFAGAATYVSLVENPTIVEAGTDLAGTYLLTTHPRPAILQTSLGAAGALAGILAGLAGNATWWTAGGIVLGGATLLQLLVVLPYTRKLLQAGPLEASKMYQRLAKLHAALSLAGLAALFIFIAKF